MGKEICVLFDMDGVILDTEPQYTKIWKHIGDKYNVGIPDFEKKIKGTTLPNILKKYFSELTEDEKSNLIKELDKSEATMDFPEVVGALELAKELKSRGVKIGLVTSSTDTKINEVNKKKHFDHLFDIIITGSQVKEGKPNPECYLLAAKGLKIDPSNCIVFEDSFAGIEAGKAAGMTVIALSTTNSTELLRKEVPVVIPDFKNFGLAELQSII